MFKKSPYTVSIESYDEIKIETKGLVTSLILEHQGNNITLNFKSTDYGYVVDISNININMQKQLVMHVNKKNVEIVKIGMITTTKQFDNKHKSNLELGSIYKKESTSFRVWSPVATDIIVNVGGKSYSMNSDGSHYEVAIEGDLEGLEYYYLVCINGIYNKVIDPYALNTTLNNSAGIIIDRNKVLVNHKYNCNNKDRMVIYETSVCDFTSDINSPFTNKGKFNSFTQSQSIGEQAIGIDYLTYLGVTHIQLMPMYDFGSVDEKFEDDANYNWGYDPIHYNVPEGSYVTSNGAYSKVLECQGMIGDIKAKGFGVIMDVVYNHVYDVGTFNYHLLVPNYYFRFKENGEFANGSFCGNEVASERSMVKRYIIDTMKTWVEIYGIDGIRVDLMGLMDINTIKLLELEMQKINPYFMIYGEGWNIESMLDSSNRATQINANKMPSIGHFNDDIRNFIKGDNREYDKIGYVQGNRDEDSLNVVLNGKALDGEKTYINKYQLINYVSCHDDHTLYDYLKINESDEDTLTKQIIKCYEFIFKTKGIPFIHSGCEFKRTKNGIKNTYNKSRQLNAIKWTQVGDNLEIIESVRELINRRKNDKHE